MQNQKFFTKQDRWEKHFELLHSCSCYLQRYHTFASGENGSSIKGNLKLIAHFIMLKLVMRKKLVIFEFTFVHVSINVVVVINIQQDHSSIQCLCSLGSYNPKRGKHFSFCTHFSCTSWLMAYRQVFKIKKTIA